MNTAAFVLAAILCAAIMFATVLAVSNAGENALESSPVVATR